jgi:hypothetical protein
MTAARSSSAAVLQTLKTRGGEPVVGDGWVTPGRLQLLAGWCGSRRLNRSLKELLEARALAQAGRHRPSGFFCCAQFFARNFLETQPNFCL